MRTVSLCGTVLLLAAGCSSVPNRDIDPDRDDGARLAPADSISTARAVALVTDIRTWDAANPEERAAAARHVALWEPDFRLQRLQRFECAGVAHEIAIFIHGVTDMQFCLLPAGTFVMGSPETEPGRDAREVQRRVTLSRPFFIARTEVTQRSWSRVMDDNPAIVRGRWHPVDNVTWNRAVEFCVLSGIGRTRTEHAECGLPTDAQWEYACRAGSTTMYITGEDIEGLRPYAHLLDERKWPSVASRLPNAFGLYDMVLGAMEWCADGSLTDAPSGDPVVDPVRIEADFDFNRSIRGSEARSAGRIYMHRGSHGLSYGFRPARTIRLPDRSADGQGS